MKTHFFSVENIPLLSDPAPELLLPRHVRIIHLSYISPPKILYSTFTAEDVQRISPHLMSL